MMGERYWHIDARAKDGGFWVETAEPTPQQKKRAAKLNREFARVPLQWAAKAAKATRTPGTMVWVALLYLSWKHNDTTFPFPNTVLARSSVNRETKRRHLQKLEEAGLIRIERRKNQAPMATLIMSPKAPTIVA